MTILSNLHRDLNTLFSPEPRRKTTMFVLEAAFSHDKDGRPCYIAGPMSIPNLKQADVYATRAAAELEADKFFPAAKVVALADIAI